LQDEKMADQKLLADVLKRIDRNELAQLTKELVDIPSPTGAERGDRRIYFGLVFSTTGHQERQAEISPERYQCQVGIIEAKRTAVSLTSIGHMDTSYTGTEEDRMFCPRWNPIADLKARCRREVFSVWVPRI
jgi:acetylornithine deacetylase/succinyl-diaminopimelate desuccinylase-like protein